MSFNNRDVCIRSAVVDDDGAFPSIRINYREGPLPPAVLVSRADEVEPTQFHLTSVGAVEKNRFLIETHFFDESGTDVHFLLFRLPDSRATPDSLGTLRASTEFNDFDLSTMDPDGPRLEGFIWTVAANPNHVRLPVKIECVNAGDGPLRLQGGDSENLELFLWPLPVKFDAGAGDVLAGQEMLDLFHIEQSLSADGTSTTTGPIMGPDVPEDLSASDMIRDDRKALDYGAGSLFQLEGRSLFKASRSQFCLSTVKLACVFSSLIYARVPLDRNTLIQRLDPKTRGAYVGWTKLGSVAVTSRSPSYPNADQASRINRQLQYMLRDSMSEMVGNANKLGFGFVPLRILHQNILYNGVDSLRRLRRAGSGPFCGVFIDHIRCTAVVAFKGTDVWDVKEVITDANATLVEYSTFSVDGQRDLRPPSLPGKIHAGIGNGLFRVDVVDFDPETGRGIEGRAFESIMKKLNGLCSTNGPYNIWVTGHSLGGGYATVFHAALLQWCAYTDHHAEKYFIPRDLITFGSLRVGNRDWVNGYDSLLKQRLPGDDVGDTLPNGYRRQHWRYVNRDDLVPHVPNPLVIPSLVYVHTDMGIRIQVKNGNQRWDPLRIQSERDNNTPTTVREKESQSEVNRYLATVDHGPIDDLREAHSTITQPIQPPIISGVSPTAISDHNKSAYWAALRTLKNADKQDSYDISWTYELETNRKS